MIKKEQMSTESSLVYKALRDLLIFRPIPPQDDTNTLNLSKKIVKVDASDHELSTMLESLHKGSLTIEEMHHAIEKIKLSDDLSKKLLNAAVKKHSIDKNDSLTKIHALDRLAYQAVNIINRLHESLLHLEPLTELHFHLTDNAKSILAIGWEAMLKRGIFPIPPIGHERIKKLQKQPLGSMHFVSASDLDGGYNYTMGIALSPEAQSLETMGVSYGLDGELIVPGQAVSPIPPFLAMGTKLFSTTITTSSNISEEVQSIPIRNYPHPTYDTDLNPKRSGIYQPIRQFDTIDQLKSDIQLQLFKNTELAQSSSQNTNKRFVNHRIVDVSLPPVKAVFDVTKMTTDKIRDCLKQLFKDKSLADQRKNLALYLNIETTSTHRILRINEIVAVAAEYEIKYVAIADNEKDEWLPNLLEYLEPHELNAVADYSDKKGVIVIDGRPVDPIYIAATSAQRIQSVYTTLSVDILKMGMWLCLDALTARIVYRELLNNPHISKRMMLMPIGIVEPWNAFVDNRNINRTPRAILDPFEKIKFMIEEAKLLGIPSLLTDTRHKETWVLLGKKTQQDEAHPREEFIRDPINNETICRTAKSAIPLLSWKEFMECERLAREAGIFLGQAGSVETSQLFKIISETTYDAAKEGKNPATGIWTAETERVLTTQTSHPGVELQSQRSAKVSPFLAVINRGFESHAKLEGWLRYLEDRQHDSSDLREKLQKCRIEVNKKLQALLKAQNEWKNNPAAKSQYQTGWDEFRISYLDYHKLIKDNFLRVCHLVEKAWSDEKSKQVIKSAALQEE